MLIANTTNLELLAAISGGGGRPPIPSRADAIRIQYHFQGLFINTATYGRLPWFTAALTRLALDGELDSVLDQVLAAGDTHCPVDLAWDYTNEPGQPYGSDSLVHGVDLTADLSTYRRIVDRVIQRGLKPIFVVPGEGPDGWAWCMSQSFVNWVEFMRDGYDRLAYGVIRPGYDGTWPASWSVSMVKQALTFMRSVIGSRGHLALMFGPLPGSGSPYLYVEDESDYSKPWMQCLDVISTTTPDGNQVSCPSLVNFAQYMLGPALRPFNPCQPEWSGPYLLAPGTPRGPYNYLVEEWKLYQFVRGQATVDEIDANRELCRTIGLTSWG